MEGGAPQDLRAFYLLFMLLRAHPGECLLVPAGFVFLGFGLFLSPCFPLCALRLLFASSRMPLVPCVWGSYGVFWSPACSILPFMHLRLCDPFHHNRC